MKKIKKYEKMKNFINKFLIRRKVVDLLIGIRKNKNLCKSKLQKQVDLSYSHLQKTLKKFEDDGLIEIENMNDRDKKAILTSKGRKLERLFEKVLDFENEK